MNNLFRTVLFVGASLVVFVLFSAAMRHFDGSIWLFIFHGVISFLPMLLLWSMDCADRAVEERSIVRGVLDVDLLRAMSSVDLNTHTWYRMTLRNPWKLYRFNYE